MKCLQKLSKISTFERLEISKLCTFGTSDIKRLRGLVSRWLISQNGRYITVKRFIFCKKHFCLITRDLIVLRIQIYSRQSSRVSNNRRAWSSINLNAQHVNGTTHFDLAVNSGKMEKYMYGYSILQNTTIADIVCGIGYICQRCCWEFCYRGISKS